MAYADRAQHRGYLALGGVVFASLVGAALLMLPRLQAELPSGSSPVPDRPDDGAGEGAFATGEPLSAGEGEWGGSSADTDVDPDARAPGSSAARASAAVPEPPRPPPCPEGMSYIEGKYCPFLVHRCAERMPDDPALAGKPHVRDRRCVRFSEDVLCEGRPSTLRVCMDRYEYPNIAGTKPAVLADYRQAHAACAAEGKRLCHEDEWALACEGAEGFPYPYGAKREPGVCNVDGKIYPPDARALANPALVSGELERIDGRIASGSAPRCVSEFGVYDMSGNVAEWVHLRAGRPAGPPFESSLMGGSWGPSEGTCRWIDTDRPASHREVQLGFRCCRDPLDGKRARELWPSGTTLPRRRKLPGAAEPKPQPGAAPPTRNGKPAIVPVPPSLQTVDEAP